MKREAILYFYDKDRYFSPDIERAIALIDDQVLLPLLVEDCRVSIG